MLFIYFSERDCIHLHTQNILQKGALLVFLPYMPTPSP